MAKLPPKCLNCSKASYDTRHCNFLDKPCWELYSENLCDCGIEYKGGEWDLTFSKNKKELKHRTIEEANSERNSKL